MVGSFIIVFATMSGFPGAGEQGGAGMPTSTFKTLEYSRTSAAFFGRADHYNTSASSIGNFYVAAGHVDKQQDANSTHLAASGSGLHSVEAGTTKQALAKGNTNIVNGQWVG